MHDCFHYTVRWRLPARGYNEDMVRVDQTLESWKSIREDTAAAVEDFPAEEFAFRATPETMAFGAIARHILVASDGLTGMLLAGEDDFKRPDFREKVGEFAKNAPAENDAAGLAAALRESLRRRTAELAARDAGFFAGMVTRMDGQRVTRLEMVQFIKEHELTHRAQLFLYLRLKGIVPATTRRRLAKQGVKYRLQKRASIV